MADELSEGAGDADSQDRNGFSDSESFPTVLRARFERFPCLFRLTRRRRMLADTVFSFANASPFQVIAFVGGAIAHIAFFVWVVYLVRH
jgi:hypothetical protein